MSKSTIEWTQHTWNPIVSGCSIISEGCTNCYAMQMANRLEAMGQEKYKGLTRKTAKGKTVWTGKININLDDKALYEPLQRKKPTMYFVNSMTDLFHEDVPFEAIDKIMAVIALCPQHTFQLLTKRPKRMKEYFDRLQKQKPILHKCEDNDSIFGITYFRDDLPAKFRVAPCGQNFDSLVNFPTPDNPENPVYIITNPFMELIKLFDIYDHKKAMDYYKDIYESNKNIKQSIVFNLPLKNLWLGVSVENQEQADKRIPYLLDTPAKVRFLSVEPLLGEIDLGLIYEKPCGCKYKSWACSDCNNTRTELEQKSIDWVIVGGESGHHARPMHPDWVRSIKNQCQEADVPFFFKQWGEWLPVEKQGEYWYVNSGVVTYTKAYLSEQHIFSETCYAAKVGKKNSGNLLDGVVYQEYPKTS